MTPSTERAKSQRLAHLALQVAPRGIPYKKHRSKRHTKNRYQIPISGTTKWCVATDHSVWVIKARPRKAFLLSQTVATACNSIQTGRRQLIRHWRTQGCKSAQWTMLWSKRTLYCWSAQKLSSEALIWKNPPKPYYEKILSTRTAINLTTMLHKPCWFNKPTVYSLAVYY